MIVEAEITPFFVFYTLFFFFLASLFGSGIGEAGWGLVVEAGGCCAAGFFGKLQFRIPGKKKKFTKSGSWRVDPGRGRRKGHMAERGEEEGGGGLRPESCRALLPGRCRFSTFNFPISKLFFCLNRYIYNDVWVT